MFVLSVTSTRVRVSSLYIAEAYLLPTVAYVWVLIVDVLYIVDKTITEGRGGGITNINHVKTTVATRCANGVHPLRWRQYCEHFQTLRCVRSDIECRNLIMEALASSAV